MVSLDNWINFAPTMSDGQIDWERAGWSSRDELGLDFSWTHAMLSLSFLPPISL